MISSTVDIGHGVQLYYEEAGKGPAIVFVHGMWASSRFFRKQMAALQQDFRVIALDLRGHGRSSMTLADHTVPSYARDLQAFIGKLGLKDFIGVGWSMGAFVWWDYYTQFGVGGLRGLVNIDQPPSDWRSAEIPDGLLTLEMLRDWHYQLQIDRNSFMRAVIPMMFAAPPAPADLEWMHDEMTRAPAVIAAAELIDQSLREYQGMLTAYPIPTLACTGAKSAQPRAAMQMIVDRVRNGRLQVFENCGHCLFLEDAPAFNRSIREFAATLSG
ncbi:MAG: alpha/beta hydrolase [Gammaproteobacteria bacterium]